LENVHSIDICRSKVDGKCLGILLHYANQSAEVLGQWRFDHHIEVMANQNVPRSIDFQLGYNQDIPYVEDITFGSCWAPGRLGCVTFTMQHCLVWWFSEQGGFVVQEEDTGGC
jgi:hypothetical protein